MSEGLVASRHRLLLILLWANVPLLAGLGLATGESVAVSATVALILIVFGTAGLVIPDHKLAASLTAVGLVAAAAVFVTFVPGNTAHLYFLVMIAAASLYRMAAPLTAAVVTVTAYHVAMVLLDPALYDPGWAALHSGFAVLLALTCAVGWRSSRPVDNDAASFNRLRMAFEAAPLGMAILRPSGEFIQVNEALARVLGYKADDLIGRNVRSIVHSDDMAHVGEAWEQMGNDESHSAISWLRCMTGTGTTIWGRVSISLVPHTDEHPAMVVLQLEDVTRSYQERRQLETLLAGKDEFVAAIGQELEGPIDVVIDLASGGDDISREIASQARRIESIVADLATSARIENGHTPVIALPVDAEMLCQDVVASFSGTERIIMEVGDTPLWSDPGLTRQVLTALVDHALRYGGDHITVRTATSGPDTVIDVLFNGPEIPESERDRMFNSDLRQGRPATKPASVGLGLTVGRHLARTMDGDLTYRRTADGENLFELRLPSERFLSGSRREDIDIPA